MANPTLYPFVPLEGGGVSTIEGPAGVAAQLGAHADWTKFLNEATRSPNLEDYRSRDPGFLGSLKDEGVQKLMMMLGYTGEHFNEPERSTDPLAVAAGYNSLATSPRKR